MKKGEMVTLDEALSTVRKAESSGSATQAKDLRLAMKALRRAKELLRDARDFFGTCWCKKSIGYTCPQCEWIAAYGRLLGVDGRVRK